MSSIPWTEQLVESFTSDVKAALARYPEDAARIHKAAVLVLDGKVTMRPDGAATVESGSGTGTYLVQGTCPCPDATHGAVEGRCKHRYARTFAKRLMAQGQEPVIDWDAFIQATQGGQPSMAAYVCDGEHRSHREVAGRVPTAGH